MSDNKKWWGRAAAALVAAGIVAVASPALAASVDSPGEEGHAYSNGDFVRVYDDEQNGESVYSHYYVNNDSGRHRIEVFTGYDTSNQSGDYSAGVDRFRACNNNNFPDACSSYVSP